VRKILIDSDQEVIDPQQLPSQFFGTDVPVQASTYTELEKKHEAERRRLLVSTLETSKWVATRAASQLGLPSSTMYDLMEKYGIQKPRSILQAAKE
jgi:transcriptional regulator with GAF, ATPase, and Fis domain